MSLETLLEAARFIELQEHAASRQPSPRAPAPQPPILIPVQQQPITIHLPPPPPQPCNGGLQPATTPCIIPCLGSVPSNGMQPQHVPVSGGAVAVAMSGGVATNGSIVGPARSIVLTATPLRIKQVDHPEKPQIAPSSNHSGNSASLPVHGIINNSFDIINPLVFDDQGGVRRKQPPLVFRSGTREVHNKLEKHRRAHLKECFDVLKQQLPATDEKKTSNLSILHSALRHIKALKNAELECEQEVSRLENERLKQQQRLIFLKREFSTTYGGDIDLSKLLDNIVHPDLIDTKLALNGNIVVKSEDIMIPGSNDVALRSTATSTPPATSLATLAISGTPPGRQEARTVTINGLKEGLGSTTFVPVTYPVSGTPLLLQKVTLLPKAPISFTAQPLNGNGASAQLVQTQQVSNKVLPLMASAGAAKYVMKPVVVVSTPSRSS